MAAQNKPTKRQQQWLEAAQQEEVKGTILSGFFTLLAQPNDEEQARRA